MSDAVGNTINLLGQSVVEGGKVSVPASYVLDTASIQHRAVREFALTSRYEGASGKANLYVVMGEHDEGDPENRLIEITPANYEGEMLAEKQLKMYGDLFGIPPSQVEYIRHNEELLAASQQAKQALKQLYPAFQKGLNPGEDLKVKAPFAAPGGGQEWMWVEVITWQKGEIKGLLSNEPRNIPGLHAGQEVNVQEAEIFDFVLNREDGTVEGDFTTPIILKMQGK